MSDASSPMRVTRRTVAKGAAWTVPAVLVAAPAASAATSLPSPEFNFENAIKNPGNSCTITGCVASQSYGVPVTVSNPTAMNLVIRFTDYITGADINGNGGTSRGVDNVGVIYGPTLTAATCMNRVSSCTLPDCASSTNSVCVAAGESYTFWVFSGPTGASANVSQYIPWEWIDPGADCAVIASDAVYSATSPPNDAC